MEPLLLDRRPLRPSRFISDSRRPAAKSARFKPSALTSSKSESALRTSWKSGVMNLGFSHDDDGGHNKLSPDSGVDDVFTPVTSPRSDCYTQIYHKALSRRKLQLEDDEDEFSTSMPPSCGTYQNCVGARQAVAKSLKTKTPNRDCNAADADSANRTTNARREEEVESDQTFTMSGEWRNCDNFGSEVYVNRKQMGESLVHVNQRQKVSPQAMKKARCLDDDEAGKGVIGRGEKDAKLTLHANTESKVEKRPSQQKSRAKLPGKHRSSKSTSHPPRKAIGTPRSTGTRHRSSPEYQTGIEAIVGDSAPLPTISDCQSEIEGVETSFGPNTEMSQVVESRYTAGSTSTAYSASANSTDSMKSPAPSAGRRRWQKLKAFRVFTAKPKRKTPNVDERVSEEATPPPPNPRLVQRRVSRLEMNEPIEDIFSEVTFETMEDRSPTSDGASRDDDSDCDEIEDPDVILQSFMNDQVGGPEETYNFKGTEDPGCHDSDDVIDQNENEQLLPDVDSSINDSTDDHLTSETDLR